MVTKVVNKYHGVPYDVYIGRGSIWGNPFSHKQGTKAIATVPTREEAIKQYEMYILNRPDLIKQLKDLEGKTLGCFCKPKACHGDVLVELIEMEAWKW